MQSPRMTSTLLAIEVIVHFEAGWGQKKLTFHIARRAGGGENGQIQLAIQCDMSEMSVSVAHVEAGRGFQDQNLMQKQTYVKH